MDLKGQAHLLARAAEDQASHSGEKLGAVHAAVPVVVEDGHHALRQELTSDSQRLLQICRIDPLIITRVG
jgi:hypothetical protein